MLLLFESTGLALPGGSSRFAANRQNMGCVYTGKLRTGRQAQVTAK